MPTAQASLYCTRDDIATRLSELGIDARLDDDASGTLDGDENPYLLRCREWATAWVKMYCLPHHDDAQVAQNWVANELATRVAVHRLCTRRLNSVPDSVQQDYDEAMEKLVLLKARKLTLPECAARRPNDQPQWDNFNVDPRYRVRQTRTQEATSDKTPAQHPRTTDWVSNYSQEY